MNKVILCGRLIKDVDLRSTNDSYLAKFTLAVDRKYQKGEEKKADFINCVAFGNMGKFAADYFHKGEAMTLEGRIQTGSYKNREGNTVYTTDVIAESIEFSIGGKNNSSSSSNNTKQTSGDGFMNVAEGLDEELPFN